MSFVESPAKILEAVKAKFLNRDRQRVQTFEGLVAKVADGRATTAEATEVLEKIQRTPDELAAAVELLARRRAWAAQVEAAEEAGRERPVLASRIAAANKQFEADVEAARVRGVDVCRPAEARLRELDAIDRQAEAARNRLADSAPQAVLDELALIKQERAKVNARADPLEKQLRATEQTAAASRAKLEMMDSTNEHRLKMGSTSTALFEYEGKDELKRVVLAADAEATELRERVAAIRAEEQALRERESAASAALLLL